jgi:PmbA protein
MSREVAERCLERLRGRAEAAEVFLLTRESLPLEWEAGKLKKARSEATSGLALRVLKGGRVGFCATTDLGRAEEAAEKALELAPLSDPYRGEWPERNAAPEGEGFYDPEVASLTPQRMADAGEELLEPIRRVHPQVQAFGGVAREVEEVWLLNSRGFEGHYLTSSFGLWGGGELVEGDNMLSAYDGLERRNLGDPEGEARRLGEKVAGMIERGRRNVPFRGGRMKVLLSPRALAHLLRPLVAALDGKAVEKGLSPWKDLRGKKVASSGLTLIDDGLYPFGPASSPFDGEGIPSRRTVLLDRGVLASFYHDLHTARSLGMEPTGNGLRSLFSPPRPAPRNLLLEGGEKKAQALLASLEEGLLIEQLMGAWAGNPYSGEVSGNVSLGFYVREGEIQGRVKDTVLSLNAFEAFREQLAALSSDREWVGSSLLPYALFESVPLSARG